MTERVRLRPLLAAQAAFMLGFSSVVPFLAVIAQSRYTLDATVIGAIVGARVAAQQGLFIVGGALADRLGARQLLATGCLVRAAGFVTIAFAGDPVTFTVGVVLAGAAGALFSPALESLVAQVDADRRRAIAHRSLADNDSHKAPHHRGPMPSQRGPADNQSHKAPHHRGPMPFAALAMAGETGGIVGALAGAAWTPQHSTLMVASSAVLFAIAAVVLARVLPGDVPRASGTPIGRQPVRLVPLILSAGGLLAVYTQLFSLMPVALNLRGADPGWVGLISAVLSLATITLQWPLSHLAERVGRQVAVPAALGVAGLACLLACAGQRLTTTAVELLAVFVAVTVLVGVAMTLGSPAAQSLIAAAGPTSSRAMRLGALATCGGVLSLLISPAAGAVTSARGPAAGWLLCAVLPLVGAPVAAWATHPRRTRVDIPSVR